MSTIASLVVRVGADIANFTSDMNRASAISKRNSKKILTSFKRMGVGVTAVMSLAVNEAVKFEKAMDEVSTLVGDTTDMDALADSVRDVSREFGKAPVEEAKALYQIISAGASTASEQMLLLNASNKLAIGGVTEVSIAADALTTILNAYGLEAENATDISDLLFVGMKQGKTTIEEMGLSIGKVATIAAQTGVGIDELVAGVATLTKSGIGTSEAMSGLQGVLSAVLKQSSQSVAMANELGVAFNLQALEAKGLAKFLDDIQVAADGDAEKLQKLFGRVEGLTAVMSLGADGAKEFNAILEATGERAGATDEAFQKMSEGSAFQLDRLKVSIQLLAEALGARLLPGVNFVAEALVRLLAPAMNIETALTGAKEATIGLNNAMKENADVAEYQAAITTATQGIIALEAEITKVKDKQDDWWRQGTLTSKVYAADIKFLEGEQKKLFKTMREAQATLKETEKKTKAIVKVEKELIKETKLTTKEIANLRKEADKLNDMYKAMAESLDPLVEIENDFNDQIEDLISLLRGGRIDQEQFRTWLAQIKGDFEDAQMAALGFDTELEELVVTAKEVFPKFAKETTGMVAIIENSFKRLDDTFADFWSNMLKDGKFSLDSLKDLFLDTIAQMIHAATTQKIVLKLGAVLTGGISSANAGGLGDLISGGGIGGGGSIFGSISSLFGGSQIQDAFGNFSDIFSGGAANWQFGVAAILGGFLGDKIFGGQGGLGGSIGATIGTAILPGIGSIIGGLLGGALGGLFKTRDPRISGTGADAVFGKVGNKGFNESALGGFFLGGGSGGVGDFRLEAIDAMQQFDQVIASFLSADQLTKVSDALSRWSVTLKKDAVSIENLLDSRFSVILGTFSSTVQDYVNQFDGLTAQTEALQKYVTALNTVGMAISAFAGSSAADVLAAQLEGATGSSTERLAAIGSALSDMFSSFDGTPEQLNEISQLVDARYRGELEYLAAIDQLVKGIASSIEAQQAKIREAVEGPRTFNDLFGEAQSLFASLAGAGSPEEIAKIVSSIQSLVDKAFGGLDAAGQVAQADTLIAFLDQVQRAAEDRANILAQQVIEEGQVLRDAALLFAESIGAPLDLNVQATQDVSQAVNNQTDVLVDQSMIGHANQESIRDAIDRLGDRLDRFVDSQGRIGFAGG